MIHSKRLLSVTSLTVGIADHAGAFVPIIPRDTPLPSKIVKTFGTAPDQTQILLSLYEVLIVLFVDDS